ncbi:hypothetical protein T484DRAFT_3117842 [Baffinella frigidus]|nr:hypothetical protein T484DRAFT_3117842 [Cryptophyta sp. CCMP2293]
MPAIVDGLAGRPRYDEAAIYTPSSTPRDQKGTFSREPRAPAGLHGVEGLKSAGVEGLRSVREVARAIYASAPQGQPYLVPPHPWWNETPIIQSEPRPEPAGGAGGECELEHLAAQGRKAPVHITYHPEVGHGPIRSPEHLATLLEAEGLQCSWAPEYNAGDNAMAQHAVVVVLLLSEGYARTARAHRVAEYAAISLGKNVVPVTLGAATWRDDEALGAILAGIRSVDFDPAAPSAAPQPPPTAAAPAAGAASAPGGAGGASAAGGATFAKPWRALVSRLHAAVKGRGAAAPRAVDGGVFVGYHARNSQLLMEYGARVS